MDLTGGEIALVASLSAGLVGFAALMTRRSFASNRAHQERIAASNADFLLFATERKLECTVGKPYQHAMMGTLNQFAVVRGVVDGVCGFELRVASDDSEYRTELELTIADAESWLPGRVELLEHPSPNDDLADPQVYIRCFQGGMAETPAALRKSLLLLAATSVQIETRGSSLRITPMAAEGTAFFSSLAYCVVNGPALRTWVDAALAVVEARAPQTFR